MHLQISVNINEMLAFYMSQYLTYLVDANDMQEKVLSI